jgi:hypothetical protein
MKEEKACADEVEETGACKSESCIRKVPVNPPLTAALDSFKIWFLLPRPLFNLTWGHVQRMAPPFIIAISELFGGALVDGANLRKNRKKRANKKQNMQTGKESNNNNS